jgi:hypothetical protein
MDPNRTSPLPSSDDERERILAFQNHEHTLFRESTEDIETMDRAELQTPTKFRVLDEEKPAPVS